MTKRAQRVLGGLPAAGGIGIGRAVCLDTRDLQIYRIPLPATAVEDEVERLRASLEEARQEIRRGSERVRAEMGDELASIFEAHALLLDDAHFVDDVVRRIRAEHVNAEWAVQRASDHLELRFKALETPHLRARGIDVRDASQAVLRSLQGIGQQDVAEIVGDAVIVADDLTPSEAVRLGRQRVVGFALEGGGRTSHTAIIAASLNVPLVAGVEGITSLVTDEDPVIVDGDDGQVILHPTAATLHLFRAKRRERAVREDELAATREAESVTRDGVAVELLANIDLPEEIDEAVRFGARGVGLYRSEFLYIERSPELPGEEEQLALYRRLIETMAPHPVTIRTFDLGGRKLARDVLETDEDNPVLGLRGIRLTLARPQIFRVQVRALLRAGSYGPLRMMLPMISTVGEVRRFRDFCRQAGEELAAEGVRFSPDFKLGVMIEVPAAALIADILAREVDFFSIGTNDLIQYALAVDRNNEHVGDLYRPLHPAILRMIRFVVSSARAAGIEVSLCGEMGADRRYTAILLGLGLRHLSVGPRRVPQIKREVSGLLVAEAERLIERCLELSTADEVEEHLDRHLDTVSGLS